MMTRKELMDYNKRKDKVIAIRVSEMEYDTIKTAAKTAKVSMTDYIKFTAQLKAMVAVDELKELITQTKRIGNNLNQLTEIGRRMKKLYINIFKITLAVIISLITITALAKGCLALLNLFQS